MKNLLAILMILSAIPKAWAEPKENLQRACSSNQSDERLGINSNCICISKSIVNAFGNSDVGLKQIKWVEKVFNETLSQADFQKDEFKIVSFIDGVLDACKTSQSKAP